MASDHRRADLFAPGHGRTGKFEDYDVLRTYYVGRAATRTRRPDSGVMPVAAADGMVRYYRDEVLIFGFKAPAPRKQGWFGFRTVHSHLRIRDVSISRPK
jgi:hypothetical protein